jgi:hypothetical protein
VAELERLSHSSAHTYNECGERWRLERVEKVDKVPWLAGPAGSAFHTMTEDYDSAGVDSYEIGSYEAYLVEALMQDGVGFDQDYRPMPGELERYRVSRGETYDWWVRAGNHMFDQYVAWRERSGWTVWESPFEPEWNEDGTATTNGWMVGIELPFEVMLPGMSVPDKGYIDRIFSLPDGRIILVDLKTWFRERSTTQLPHYFAVAQDILGIPVDGVAYYDARLGRPTGIAYPTDDPEKPWDIDRLTGLLLPVERGIIGDVFEPKPGSQCGWCSVAHHCAYKLEKKK